jgi:hypothetical protein
MEYDIVDAQGVTVVSQDVTTADDNTAATYAFTHSIGLNENANGGPGTYYAVGLDTYGDGWNGGTFTITSGYGEVYVGPNVAVSSGHTESGFRYPNAKTWEFYAKCDGSTMSPTGAPSLAPPPEPCTFGGVERAHGDTWVDGCRQCECDDNEVWCLDSYKVTTIAVFGLLLFS